MQVNYQTLLTCLKLTIRIAKHEWREKISDQNAILLGLKIIDWKYRRKECKETSTKSINELIENFPSIYQFYNGDLSIQFNSYLFSKNIYIYI